MASMLTGATLIRRGAPVVGALALLLGVCVPAVSPAEHPTKIGVIGEASSVSGASITNAAQMAADDVNAHGGVNGRQIEVIIYEDTLPPPTPFERFSALPPKIRSQRSSEAIALPHADRVYVLEHARVVWAGEPAKFAAEMGEGYL